MTFSTAQQVEQSAYDAVPQFNRIHGRPTRAKTTKLRNKIATYLVTVGMLFEANGDYGLLGEIVTEDEYTQMTDGLDYKEPEKLEPYNKDITVDMDEVEQKNMEAAHAEKLNA